MDELTREGFARLTEALTSQAKYLDVLTTEQKAQGEHLASVDRQLHGHGEHLASLDQHLASLDGKQDAVLEQLRRLNENILRGFTQLA